MLLKFSIDINIVDIIINLLIAIVTSVITASVSLKHFYRQEIWLRKESKYSEIIDKLCIILNYYDKQMDIRIGAYNGDAKELNKEYDKTITELEKIRYSTGFMIKPEVNEIIDKMIRDFELKGTDELHGDYYSYSERVYGIIKKSIAKIINIANKELKKD